MLIVKVSLVIIFLSMSFASEEKYYSHLSRELPQLNTDRSSRVKKRQKEVEYFEQCHFVNMWKEQLGHISVLAFLDPAWFYSFRQAVMMKLLSSRLQKSGFPDIRFFVIAPPPNLTKNKIEDDLEIEAWREIGTIHETENWMNANDYFFNGSEMIFVQDNPQSRLWERFRASKNQVVVIDRCGKLTYQVMVPWSILYFPYVKAAILSTYQEDPCGCDPTVYRTLDYKDSLINNTDKEADSRETESSAFSGEIINGTDRFNFSNVTESSIDSEAVYQYDNGMTKSSFNENNLDTEKARNQESSINLENSTISSETAATFGLQQNVSSKQNKFDTQTLINDHSITASYGDTTNRILFLNESTTGEVKSDLMSTANTKISEDIDDDEARATGMQTLTSTPSNIDTSENADHFKESPLSLRIIMRAPHVHKNKKKMKKYTHLILKIGDPDFHGHLDSGIDVTPPQDLWRGTGVQVTSSEERDRGTTKVDTDNGSGNQEYAFSRDESPGFYGEVADYWNWDITDRNETFNDTYNNSTNMSYNEEYHINVSDHTVNFSKSSEIDESYSTANVVDTILQNITNVQSIFGLDKIDFSTPISIEDQDDREEEMYNEVIQHYSKLLSWIDYKLNK